MNPCQHCMAADHSACWGVGCSCLVCMADDKDEFRWQDVA